MKTLEDKLRRLCLANIELDIATVNLVAEVRKLKTVVDNFIKEFPVFTIELSQKEI
jgi:hypothetical protein